MAAVELKPLPFEAALDFFKAKGLRLRPSHSYRDIWQDAHSTAFTVAKSAGFDILRDVHAALVKTLQEGGTLEDFQRGLKPVLIDKGWWGRAPVEDPLTGKVAVAQLGSPRRLKTIFDVNLRTAHAAGHHALIERTKRSRPFLRYVAVLDDRTRDEHAKWHGIILPVDHPWWETHYPPNGWNCRCTVQSLSAEDIEREGWKVTETPPKDKLRTFVNDRTGESQEVPDGVDPAFAYNIGKAGAVSMEASARRAVLGKIPEDQTLGQAAVRGLVESEAFDRFLEEPAGVFPVLRLSDAARAAIGAENPVAILSDATLAKNLKNHRDVTTADYRLLPGLGEAPDLIVQDGGQTLVLVKRGEVWYSAAVKATETGKATFLTSFRRTHARDIARLKRVGKVIFGE